ncbi:MAG: 16S rRNA (uracil(1498)-N(3))-methyltransferase [Fluviicola sp.]|nr:MAG: 16S rRNA (uracil(1498)-N(3))-methyltransferase [Fluviicola sp.]
MRSFFIQDATLDLETLKLPEEESKHACKVLRMQEGHQLSIVNGKGDELIAEIIDANNKACEVKKVSFKHTPPDNFQIHIAIAPTKMNDRFEWFLEKATELGIHRITPLLCSNSERKKVKLERYQKVIVSAMKQSKRLYLPHLDNLTSLDNFIKSNPIGVLAHCYEGEKNVLSDSLKKKNCPILIGPEGDFTNLEVEKLIQSGYQPITLGETRLRTETAGIYACAISKFLFE